MLSVQPTVELATRFSRQRIEPLIAESPALRERVKPSRARDAGNTVLSKEFPAGLLIITGANSAVGLRSMPARYLFLDEVDAYPPSADEEGDPVALAEFDHSIFTSAADVLAHAAQFGKDVVITYDAADTVTLVGVHLNQLTAQDFQIV